MESKEEAREEGGRDVQVASEKRSRKGDKGGWMIVGAVKREGSIKGGKDGERWMSIYLPTVPDCVVFGAVLGSRQFGFVFMLY